jgi:hypothetical protein
LPGIDPKWNVAMTMIDLMEEVFRHPTLFLGKNDIWMFESFLHGWSLGRTRNDENHFIRSFHKWALEKHKHELTTTQQGWAPMFDELGRKNLEQYMGFGLNITPEEAALKIMGEDWQEFLKECLVHSPDIIPYDPAVAKTVKPFRSIDEPWSH